MIGNDIVDIIQSRRESNWQRKGFIEKLFTDREQMYISNSPDNEVAVWQLWSMKEAVYKIYNRQTKQRKFIPKELECTIGLQDSTSITGQVKCFNIMYHTKTVIRDGAIHTVAVFNYRDFNNVIEIEIENKFIVKDSHGIPYLFDDVNNLYKEVSISNHGRFEKTVTINNLIASI